MTTAIRKHLRDFIAIAVLVVIALVASYIIVQQQRLRIPILESKPFELKAEFQTAQAVVPGQGQTIRVAGVRVGDVENVQLEHGVGVVTFAVDRKYLPIYRNATVLMRPATGLKDMFFELDPGTKSAGEIPDGGTISTQNTAPDVNLDEVLSSLDSDTRTYLQILINSGGEAFGKKGYTADLRSTFKRFEPTNRYLARITGLLAKRRENIRHVIHNFSLLTTELGKKDKQIAEFVGSANANFRALANQSANIQESLRLLPPTLTTARTALVKADALAKELGPTAEALRPFARELGPALVQVRPFLRTTTPVIKNQIRPFAVSAQPNAKQLRILGDNLKPLTPKLTSTFQVVNSLFNTLAYNPPGEEEGFLFWTAWANHDANTIFATQDAHGPVRRGLIVTSCDSLSLLNQVVAANPPLNTLFQLLNAPAFSKVCPAPVPGAPKGKSKKQVGTKPAPDSGTQGSPTPGKPTTPPKTVDGGAG